MDQQLTSLSQPGTTVHSELDIPPAPADTPYALQILLDLYREQFLKFVEMMKGPTYKDNVESNIQQEKVIYIFLLQLYLILYL